MTNGTSGGNAKKNSKKAIIGISILVLALLCGAAWFVFGRGSKGALGSGGSSKSEFLKAEAFKIEENGKYGLVDNKGKVIVKPEYDDIMMGMYEGMAAVKVGSNWGFIDSNGNMVIEPQYDNARFFNEGLAYVSKNKQGGFIDKKGNMVITLKEGFSSYFQDGMAPIYVNLKVGFIDKKGKVVIQPEYHATLGEHFQNGYVILGNDIINTKGEKTPIEVNRSSFTYANTIIDVNHYGISDGFLAVSITEPKGYVDAKGKLVLKDVAGQSFSEGLAPVLKDGKWGFIDTKGKVVIEHQFSMAGVFREGLAFVIFPGSEKKCGYIDKKGNLVIELKAISGGEFMNGVAIIYGIDGDNRNWGYIDVKGNYIWRYIR